MNESATTPKKRSTADAVRRRVERSRDRFWHAEDFEGSHTAVLRELSRLAAEGRLRHIRKGLYWRGRETMLGMSGPTPTELVQELVGSAGVGPAEWSAALALGLSTQHPRQDVIAVPTRPPSLRLRVELRDRRGREGRARNKLNWWEVAMLEVLADWSRVIEVPRDEAVSTLVRWLNSEKVRPKKLADAARDEPAVVREGLRGLLARGGLKAELQRVPPAHTPSVRDQALAVA